MSARIAALFLAFGVTFGALGLASPGDGSPVAERHTVRTTKARCGEASQPCCDSGLSCEGTMVCAAGVCEQHAIASL